MADWKKMYFLLFHTLTDVIAVLQDTQKGAEQIFMETVESSDGPEKEAGERPGE